MMTFTFADRNLSVQLPNPEFGDKLSIDYRKYIKYSRGKELIVGKESGYDNLIYNVKLSYQFTYVSEPAKQRFFNFLETITGQIVELEDYNTNIWGIIIINPIEITNSNRNNNSFQLDAEVIYIGRRIGPYIIPQGYLSELQITEGYE